MKLIFESRPSYGENRYYPVSPHAATLTDDLIGRTCLRDRELRILKVLGVRFVLQDRNGEAVPFRPKAPAEGGGK
jgi:hypothetical protein